jgi:hypothetical protein
MRRALIILAVVVLSLPIVAQSDEDVLSDILNTITWSVELDRFLPACDYDNPITRNWAVRAADVSGDYTIEQVCNIFDALNLPAWRYVADPVSSAFGEYVAKASESCGEAELRGDCDDFAVLMASAIRAIGGACRILLAHASDGSGHAFAEVYIGPDDATANVSLHYVAKRYHWQEEWLWVDRDGGIWLLLDWSRQSPRPGAPPVILPKDMISVHYIPVFDIVAAIATGSLPIPSAP